jgi:desulfoferrodoxin (superoxide reductase-like protein)
MNKSRIAISILLTSTLVFSLVSYAHPPTKIDINFNNEDKILKVEIYHPVLAPENHYIKGIEIYINDNLKIIQKFDRQLSKESQKAGYFLFEAKKGDVIKIKAYCNKHGDKTATLVVQ